MVNFQEAGLRNIDPRNPSLHPLQHPNITESESENIKLGDGQVDRILNSGKKIDADQCQRLLSSGTKDYYGDIDHYLGFLSKNGNVLAKVDELAALLKENTPHQPFQISVAGQKDLTISLLGQGITARVYNLNHDDQNYALKVFKSSPLSREKFERIFPSSQPKDLEKINKQLSLPAFRDTANGAFMNAHNIKASKLYVSHPSRGWTLMQSMTEGALPLYENLTPLEQIGCQMSDLRGTSVNKINEYIIDHGGEITGIEGPIPDTLQMNEDEFLNEIQKLQIAESSTDTTHSLAC